MYVGAITALFFAVNIAWTKPYVSLSINSLAMVSDTVVVSYFVIILVERLRTAVDDPFFKDDYLTYYFYGKMFLTFLAVFVSVRRRHKELQREHNRYNSAFDAIAHATATAIMLQRRFRANRNLQYNGPPVTDVNAITPSRAIETVGNPLVTEYSTNLNLQNTITIIQNNVRHELKFDHRVNVDKLLRPVYAAAVIEDLQSLKTNSLQANNSTHITAIGTQALTISSKSDDINMYNSKDNLV